MTDMNLGLSAKTPPKRSEILKILPVQDLKDHKRILHSKEDGVITDAIQSAYYRLDGPFGLLNRAILEQTWVGFVSELGSCFEVPLAPDPIINAFTYMDKDEAVTAMPTDLYGIRATDVFSEVYLKSGSTWPAMSNDAGGVSVDFTVGYATGDEVNEAMPNFRRAMLVLATHYYENPDPMILEGRVTEIPRKVVWGLDHLIGQYRVVNDHS